MSKKSNIPSDPAERARLLAGARVANAIPEETTFWDEVEAELDALERAKNTDDRVSPRKKN